MEIPSKREFIPKRGIQALVHQNSRSAWSDGEKNVMMMICKIKIHRGCLARSLGDFRKFLLWCGSR